MKTWIIRKAEPPDAPSLEACVHAAYARHGDLFEGQLLPAQTADYTSEITDYPTWVVESEGHILAGLILMPEKEAMRVANIAVHPDAQGLGLGKALLSHAEQQAAQSNYSRIVLATHARLVDNVSYYTHLGWKIADQDHVRVRMIKQVSKQEI